MSSTQQRTRTIDIGIFTALVDKIPNAARAIELSRTPDTMFENLDEYQTNETVAAEAIMAFLSSFFIQFFGNGYGLDVDPITFQAKATINGITDEPNRPKPVRMITSLNEYYALVDELDTSGSHVMASLKSAYFSTLPTALSAFGAEGTNVIGNYGEVMQAAAHVSTLVSAIGA